MIKGFDINAVKKGLRRQLEDHVRARLGAIRHPVTGEFPTIVVDGDDLERMSVRIEGSPELLKLVRERLGSEADDMILTEAKAAVPRPRAFLSYAFEDRDLAETIARGLQANGIDTWWAEWCIGAGHSLRQKIDAGLATCTHFIALLTPTSINKPWVNQEMDAGLVLKIQSAATFIPLRHGLPAGSLPPLLSGMLSPEIIDPASDLPQLINDILGVTRKPPLGPLPSAAQVAKNTNTDYSPAATTVAKLFVESSRDALFGSPQFTIDAIAERTGLSVDDAEDALHELSAFFRVAHDTALPKDELFATFDKYWKDWDPADDALRIAADLVNDATFPKKPELIAQRYGWCPRRFNPAVAYLLNRKLILDHRALGTAPWIVFSVSRNDETRRFVKSRST